MGWFGASCMKMIDYKRLGLSTVYTPTYCVWTASAYICACVCVAGQAWFFIRHRLCLNSIILYKDQMGSKASPTYIKETEFNDMFNDSLHWKMGFIWNPHRHQKEVFSPPIRGILWKTDSLFQTRIFFFFSKIENEELLTLGPLLMSDSNKLEIH